MSTLLTAILPAQIFGAADSTASADVERRVLAEQIRQMYRQTPIFTPLIIIAAPITVAMQWPVISSGIAVAWCLLIWLVCGAYWVLYRRWRKAAPDDRAMAAWAGPYSALAWLTTASWGLTGLLFFQSESFLYQAVLLVPLALGSAAITVTSTAFSPAFYSVVLMLTPLSLRMAYEGGLLYQSLAAGLLIFTLCLILLHRSANRSYSGNLRLRFENEALVEQLAAQRDIAEQANIAKSRFLASASHDLRQPLHALGLFLGELHERIDEPVAREKLLQRMDSSLEAMSDLFSALLDISRFDAGAVQPELRNFRVASLLRDLEFEYAGRAATRGLNFRQVPCNAVIRSDPLLLRRILRNLIENAIRYTQTGGIVIGCRRDGDSVQLQVCDSGIGIEDQQLENVFGEFYQINNPERDRHKGLGLGLAVVKQLAALLGHTVSVQSKPGRGSVFSLQVACADAVTDEHTSESETGVFTDRLESACVLIVDDEDSVREGTRGLLEAWGCVVIAAATIDEALTAMACSPHQPDVLVTDFRLRNRVSGVDVINQVRSSLGVSLPAIMITGDTSGDETASLRGSDITLLHKPVNPGRLGTLLRFLLTDKETSGNS